MLVLENSQKGLFITFLEKIFILIISTTIFFKNSYQILFYSVYNF
jgi:hypothetical protein